MVTSLQDENSRLQDRLIDYTQVKQENERLKVQLHISQQAPENEMGSASVIGRDPNDPFSGFSIGIGTLSGVSEGDPVITDKGLVGIVSRAYATTSKVDCLLSEDVSVAAVSIDKQESGLIGGGRYHHYLRRWRGVPGQPEDRRGAERGEVRDGRVEIRGSQAL